MAAALLFTACGPRVVTVEFYPFTRDEHFTCTGAWGYVGTTSSIIQPHDFRALVSEVQLLTASGELAPLKLDENGNQRGGVGLLDFEDASGTCKQGTKETAFTLVGELGTEAPLTGLQFRLGVPPALAPDAASVPGGPQGMFDAARGQALGMRVELESSRQDFWRFHLATACVEPGCVDQRPTVRLEGMDPSKKVILFDLLELLAEANVDSPAIAPDDQPGCASQPGDPDCAPLLKALGEGAPQRVLRESPWDVGSIDHEGHLSH